VNQGSHEQLEKGEKERTEFLEDDDENSIVDCLESISEKDEVAPAKSQIERSR